MRRVRGNRPKTTKNMILSLFNGWTLALQNTHHGLFETPLYGVYPVLNLDETLAFAIGSRVLRANGDPIFAGLAREDELYPIFNEALREGMPVVNIWKNKGLAMMSNRDRTAYQEMNPFRGFLEYRLGEVDGEIVSRLVENLQKPALTHVFECDYQREKRKRDGDNSGLAVMRFQTVFPRRGQVAGNYAAEISRIISGYPQEYDAIASGRRNVSDSQMALF